MHRSSIKRMEWFKETFLAGQSNLKILDVGSYDVNGTYKPLFEGHDYIGLDIVPGPNVDIVAGCYDWSMIENDTFDVVISGQAFEHIEFWWLTLEEMARVLKKDGLLCIIAPQGFGEHRHPVDCYRFFTDGMIAMANYVSLHAIHAHTDCQPHWAKNWHIKNCADSMLVAKKPYSGEARKIDKKNYKVVASNHQELRHNLTPWKKWIFAF